MAASSVHLPQLRSLASAVLTAARAVVKFKLSWHSGCACADRQLKGCHIACQRECAAARDPVEDIVVQEGFRRSGIVTVLLAMREASSDLGAPNVAVKASLSTSAASCVAYRE
eukprot:700760-Prymnesium_polylepis.2